MRGPRMLIALLLIVSACSFRPRKDAAAAAVQRPSRCTHVCAAAHSRSQVRASIAGGYTLPAGVNAFRVMLPR